MKFRYSWTCFDYCSSSNFVLYINSISQTSPSVHWQLLGKNQEMLIFFIVLQPMDKKGKEFGTVIWQPVVPFNFVCWTLYICSCILIWLRCFPASLKFSSLPSPPFQGFSGRDFFYITVKFKTYWQCVWYMYITRGFPSMDDMHWPTLLSQNWASWAVIDLLQHAVPPKI